MLQACHYQVIPVPNSKIRGIIPTCTIANPTAIKLIETDKDNNQPSLSSLWQTLCHTAPEIKLKANLPSAIEYDRLVFNSYAENSEFNIVFYQDSQQPIEDPHQLFWDAMSKLTINPLEFLRSEPLMQERQIARIRQILTTATPEQKYPLSLFSLQENKVLFDTIDFTKCTMEEKVRFSLAVVLALKPQHKVIHIAERWLLNPVYLNNILEIANHDDYYFWVTTSTYPGTVAAYSF